MTVAQRLTALREKMREHGITIYYVPTNDFHGSEYLDDYFKCREYLSGFTGSAGSLVVLAGEAGLWTDGRYFLQAEQQLVGTGITLYRMQEEGVPSVPEFIREKLSPGQCLGFDGRLVNSVYALKLADLAEEEQCRVNSTVDLVGEIWADRPAPTVNPAYSLAIEYTGKTRREKLGQVREWMEEQQVDVLVLPSLDEIAWLLNVRGSDIHCNPVVSSYLLVARQEIFWYVREGAVGEDLEQELKEDNVLLRDYDRIYADIRNIDKIRTNDKDNKEPKDNKAVLVNKAVKDNTVAKDSKAVKDNKAALKTCVALDSRVASSALAEAVPSEVELVDISSPVYGMKAVKNPTEVANERLAHIRDGVALVRFIYWLKHNVATLPLTELRAARKLEELRQQGEHYMGPSFDPIVACGPHGAIVHYSATPETDAPLTLGEFVLLDTGGHYLEGTTDVTRTVLLGSDATPEQKKYYTAVLRGNLSLAAAKFKQGCCGVNLDHLARAPLWEMGCDYNHGTGHGVGYFLNVHEGPNAIRSRILQPAEENAVLEEGMITSNEPGIYLPERFGIRLENLIVCEKREKTEFGQFMGFETLTMAPFERDAIAPEQMTEREITLLNDYHQLVYETISPYLDQQEAEWLWDVCAPIV